MLLSSDLRRLVLLVGLVIAGFLNISTPLQAKVIFSNLRGPCCGGVGVFGANFGGGSLAAAFTPTETDSMTRVRVVVFQVLGAGGGDGLFNISLFSDANGVPGSLIDQVATNVTAFPGGPGGFVNAPSSLMPVLHAYTQYWLVLTPGDSSTQVSWEGGGSPAVPVYSTRSTTGQGGWVKFSATGTDDLQFEIDGGQTCVVPREISQVEYVISDTRVLEFDQSGNFILQFGGTGSGPGQFQLPSGIVVDFSGSVFVADAVLNRIQRFDSCGDLLSRFGTTGTGPGFLNHPYGLAVDPTNLRLWVADTGNNRIQVFNSFTGAFETQIGRLGGGNGQFNAPIGVAVTDDKLWVSDTGNNRVQQFNVTSSSFGSEPTVTFNLKFGSYGNRNGQFRGPFTVATDGTNAWVADSQNQRIQQFTTDGAFVGAISPFSFPSPYGIAFDWLRRGVWAVDYNTNTVTLFGPTGSKLIVFGTIGGGPGQFFHPTYIATGLNSSIV